MDIDHAGSRRGLMLVVSSPSGAGKTSLSRRLIADYPALSLSISCTTRDPRSGEQDGREYHFITQERFQEMVSEDAFLEHAWVHEHRYGTPREPVMRVLAEGRDVLFDIDWQGAQTVAGAAPGDVVRIFILPPSMAELKRRLHGRGQDAADVIERRLGRARGEISKWAQYDYVVVNDDLDQAYAQVARAYEGERLSRARNLWLEAFVNGLMEEPG